jgi:predicted DNA-binding protein (MmcQ/YjbR family)
MPAVDRDDPYQQLRRTALSYPETHEDHPWGETVIKVRGKVFCFLGSGDGTFGLSVKLPQSAPLALAQPGVTPTRYGLGKAGWVSGRFALDDPPPIEMLEAWLDESYRAVAPRKLVVTLDSGYSPGVSADATMNRQ